MMWTSCSEKRAPGRTQAPDGPPPTSASPIRRAKADLPKAPPKRLIQDHETDENPQGFNGPVFGAQELYMVDSKVVQEYLMGTFLQLVFGRARKELEADQVWELFQAAKLCRQGKPGQCGLNVKSKLSRA